MNAQLRKLKIKIMSLSAEQVIIRKETWKAKAHDRWARNQGSNNYVGGASSLVDHRVNYVRPHLRSCFIAYGLIRGKKLGEIETPRSEKSLARKPYKEPNWEEIGRLIRKYGTQTVYEQMKSQMVIPS